jgi:hypothetical protein
MGKGEDEKTLMLQDDLSRLLIRNSRHEEARQLIKRCITVKTAVL